MNRKDVTLASLCAVAAAAWVFALSQRIDLNVFSQGGSDVYFDADIWRTYGNMFLHPEQQNRANLHPFFGILVVIPFLFLKFVLGLDAVQMIPVVVVAAGAMFSALVYFGLRVWRFSEIESLIFTAFTLVTGSVLIFSPIVESFIFGAMSILLCFLLFARKPRSIGFGALTLVVTYGITFTNVIVGMFAVFLAFPTWKTRLRVIGLAFAIILALSLLEFVPAYPLKGNSNSLSGESRFFYTPSFSRLTSTFRTVFVDSVVLPVPELAPMPLLRKFRSSDLGSVSIMNSDYATNPVSLAALFSWGILFLFGVYALFSSQNLKRERLFLFFGLGFNFILHTLYGDEKFLYSLHWLPFLVFLAAFAVRIPKKKLATAVAAFAILPIGIHNYAQTSRVRELTELPARNSTEMPFELFLLDSSGKSSQALNLSLVEKGAWSFETPNLSPGVKKPTLLIKSKGNGSIFSLSRNSQNIHINYRWTVTLSSLSSVFIDGQDARPLHPPIRFPDGQGVARIELEPKDVVGGRVIDSLSLNVLPELQVQHD